MKVLIANPAFRRDMGDGLERYLLGSGIRFPWSMLKYKGKRPRFAIFPMFLGYTAALLEKAGLHVRALDGVPLDLHDETFVQRAVEASPDIIILEPNSAVITDVLRMAEVLKDKTHAIIVLVGTHATAQYRELINNEPVVDYIVRGEFEYGVLDLVQALREGTDVHRVQGIVWREADGQAPVRVAYARKVESLDALPMPARHLFPAWFDNDMSAYKDGFYQGSPAFDMHATRGCPYSCNFCAWVHVLYQDGPQRLRDPSSVVDEMEILAHVHGAREIYFDDDNFSANRKFVVALCDELMRRNSNIRWSALTDAIALNDGLLQRMADAGCVGIKFGLDSADSEVLRSTNKPLKVSRVHDIVKQATRLGIKTHMTVVLGLSGETRESLERTFKFACDLDIDSIQISIATPMPGTPLYSDLEKNKKLDFKHWEELDGYASTVINYEHFSRQYIEDFVAHAHTRWLRSRMRHPLWIIRQFRYLGRLGAKAGLRGLYRRAERFYRIVSGDSTACGCAGNRSAVENPGNAHTPTVRW
jgi:anaerobic magnesium-protoporphyrin IX monomethyl ester cyclase